MSITAELVCDVRLEPELQPVDLLDGRYRIAAAITRTEVATIYRARDLADHLEIVAVKVPFRQIECSAAWHARFRREEKIGLGLSHPGVLRYLPVNTPRSHVYLVTEYVPGRTLADLMRSTGPLPEAEALRIAGQVGGALHYLHEEGLVHRDLKPSGILLGEDGSVRISDFGFAAVPARGRHRFARWRTPFGVPAYLAPEQVANGPADERTDVYRLGVVLYEMLTGTVPCARDDPWAAAYARLHDDPVAPRRLNDRISPAVEELVLHALQRWPEDRYPTAAAFRAAIGKPGRAQLTDRQIRAHSSGPPTTPPVSPVVAGIVLGTSALVGLLGLFCLLWGLFRR